MLPDLHLNIRVLHYLFSDCPLPCSHKETSSFHFPVMRRNWEVVWTHKPSVTIIKRRSRIVKQSESHCKVRFSLLNIFQFANEALKRSPVSASFFLFLLPPVVHFVGQSLKFVPFFRNYNGYPLNISSGEGPRGFPSSGKSELSKLKFKPRLAMCFKIDRNLARDVQKSIET